MVKRILIADDSMLMRRMIADSLVEDGWTTVGEAADGREAFNLYKQLRPDAVTLDIVMPEMGGLEALAAILEYDPDAKIVVVSALNQTRVISEAIRHGAHDFIAKPFTSQQLRDTMQAVAETVDQLNVA